VSERLLEGQGAGLVRELALASRVQRSLERLYQLGEGACVSGFADVGAEGEREALFVREEEGEMELHLRLPQLGDLDSLVQIVEGASHFVYLVDRASTGRETTQLELELQAEVDKWVVLASGLDRLDERTSAALRARLYDHVHFAHGEHTAEGERYRVANERANRWVWKLERRYVRRGQLTEMRGALRRFFRSGQAEKLSLTE